MMPWISKRLENWLDLTKYSSKASFKRTVSRLSWTIEVVEWWACLPWKGNALWVAGKRKWPLCSILINFIAMYSVFFNVYFYIACTCNSFYSEINGNCWVFYCFFFSFIKQTKSKQQHRTTKINGGDRKKTARPFQFIFLVSADGMCKCS